MRDARPPLKSEMNINEFQFRPKDFKKYPHFDRPISEQKLLKIVTDPQRVKTNAFFPFIQYEKQYQPFRSGSSKSKKKTRLIRYASRRDSAIFTYYRYLLAQRYEDRLKKFGIGDVPIAYRKIPRPDSKGGKCNIDFAGDVFDEVMKQGDCVVVAMDISKYFENIGHAQLYEVWCNLLSVDKLPSDHMAVFKAITNYAWVDREEVYERLGYFGYAIGRDGVVRREFFKSYRDMPEQLCTPKEFREKILGQNPKYTKLVKKNDANVGIPQGAPISDLLANAYLLNFDVNVQAFVGARNGRYWRYSDDIIVVVPGGKKEGESVSSFIASEITKHGGTLQIKPAKTCVVSFKRISSGGLTYKHISGAQGKNGLEYLGFRFDGKRIYLRDSTVSNFYRKITRRARKQARHHVARYSGKSKQWLIDNFNYREFEERFGRVEDFVSIDTPKGWTFWTYARRASERFGPQGSAIYRQIKNYRGYIKRTVHDEIRRQLQAG